MLSKEGEGQLVSHVQRILLPLQTGNQNGRENWPIKLMTTPKLYSNMDMVFNLIG